MMFTQKTNVLISIVSDPDKTINEKNGIPNEFSKLVFEPFYRLSGAVFEQFKTLDFGLGLTLIEKIVQKHGGEVDIKNIQDNTDLKMKSQTKVNLTISLPVSLDD